jgi:hypothetical protein
MKMLPLEVEAYFSRDRPGRHIMRAAERGEEVVQRIIIGNIDDRDLRAPLEPVTVENVVVAHGQIEKTPGGDSWRIAVVVLGVRRW